MKNLLVALALSACSISGTIAQDHDPDHHYHEGHDHDFHAPLGIPLILSSNFGELRPNHFHMGLDFKTNNKIGYNLYSIEEGWVSRVKVSPYGYGRVVYVDHPNGLTSVYAHCSEFKGKLDSVVKAVQEKEQNFAIEYFPKKNEIPLKKGEVFALSGNSGGSTAPHLHFEIRDTKTEAALNPLHFFEIADHKKPEIRRVKFYAVTKDGYRYPGKAIVRTASKGGSGYFISNNKITLPANYCSETGGIGLAFDAIDRFDGASNQCGLYGSIMIVDGDTIFGQSTDRVPFESTRYVNSHKDYEAYQASRHKYHKCFKTTENDLPIYRYNENGVLNLKPGDSKKITYIAYDHAGNKSVLKFTLAVAAGTMNSEDGIGETLEHLRPSAPMKIENNTRRIEFGLQTTYEPLKINADKINTVIGKANIPVQKAYQIHIKSDLPNDGKNYLEITTAKGRKRALDVTYENGWYTADSKYFGSYRLRRDTLGPTLRPLNFKSTSSYIANKTMTFRLSDSQSGVGDYDMFIDNKWYVIAYDYKGGGKLTFIRPKGLSGIHDVKLIGKDDCGNETVWEKKLTFP